MSIGVLLLAIAMVTNGCFGGAYDGRKEGESFEKKPAAT